MRAKAVASQFEGLEERNCRSEWELLRVEGEGSEVRECLTIPQTESDNERIRGAEGWAASLIKQTAGWLRMGLAFVGLVADREAVMNDGGDGLHFGAMVGLCRGRECRLTGWGDGFVGSADFVGGGMKLGRVGFSSFSISQNGINKEK